jgi:hypothetical protein
MKQSFVSKNRKELENKMVKVFEKDMESLPVELRKIMANDLVSAFESRLCVLTRAQSNLKFIMITEGEVKVETV